MSREEGGRGYNKLESSLSEDAFTEVLSILAKCVLNYTVLKNANKFLIILNFLTIFNSRILNINILYPFDNLCDKMTLSQITKTSVNTTQPS